ncbi:ABC transporter substrate-binding protein [Acidithrix sp. C25]|nr:ABC transporter substrate-binding protein [Acidithrix sp. C25]CAG4901955.1 unnamed protein product [Acidithrix sp. C25]
MRVGATGGGSADSLDAQNGYTTIDGARIGQLYQALVSYNAKGELVYELAESITPDATATNWTVRLRPGITFHDGKPLTADDVIFSIQRIMNPKSPLPGAASLGPIDLANLKKVDNLTVKIPYTQPYATLLDQMSYYYFQYIVPVGYDPTKPNGTGPYKYKSFTPGQQSTFVRNPNYWKAGLPYLDEVIITDFADEASMLNALQAGELDAIGGIGAQSYNSLKSNTGVSTLSSKSGAFQPFTMRVDQKPFSDVRVRQAFRLAVNRPELINSSLGGYGFVGADVSSPFDPYYDHSLTRQQDIPQAKHLLKAAGYPELAVTLVTSPIALATVQMAEVFAQQASAAGIKVKLNDVNSTTFFGPNYLSWTFSQDYYAYTPYLAQVAASLAKNSPFNETHWTNAHYNSLYQQANAEVNTQKRKAIAQEMMLIDFNEGGYIIPCFTDVNDAFNAKLAGFQTSVLGIPLNNFDFEQIYWAK